MARLFPNKPAGNVSPETAKVLHALRRIPGENLRVWLALPLGEQWRPALMVMQEEQSCHLIAVSDLSEAQAEAMLQVDLFAGPETTGFVPGSFVLLDRERLAFFRAEALAEAGLEYGGDRLPIFLAVAFPNVPQAQLDEIGDRGQIHDVQFWGRETIRSEPLIRRIEHDGLDQMKLPEAMVNALREKFSPEIGIPESLIPRVREKPDRTVGARLTGFLLDLDQEFLTKEDLSLSEEAGTVLREMRLRLVTGVAGSGKSLILLYRAMIQAKLYPKARILVLTHNRPLNGELRERFRRLCPNSTVQWSTFYQWCREFSGARWEIIKLHDRERLLRDLAGANSALAKLPLNFLTEEIDWIRDHGLATREAYCAVTRLGRKRALQDEQRAGVFLLLENYRAELDRRGLEDWPGAAAAVWAKVECGHLSPPLYDFVFIDEAQFFAPIWFRVIKRSVKPGVGQLFLAADPTQGFLKRRQSWLAGGLNVRGQSARLLRCYRNTREILAFATAFYRSRLPGEEEEINLPGPLEIERLNSGDAPRLLAVDSLQSEISRVANEIASALRAGANPEHFLVMQNDGAMVVPFIETLNRIVGSPIGRDLGDRRAYSPGVRVSSINAGTGLESPVVFLCGLDALLEKEAAIGLDTEERAELVRDNTRRIYMSMTRAGRKLLVTCSRRITRECLEPLLATVGTV
ncbi:MAG: UvrD/REP helicase [Chthoniobacteraceae bacterium]|nr:UvrD/REP helicase [Chthoniobacteraceae bacterium]